MDKIKKFFLETEFKKLAIIFSAIIAFIVMVSVIFAVFFNRNNTSCDQNNSSCQNTTSTSGNKTSSTNSSSNSKSSSNSSPVNTTKPLIAPSSVAPYTKIKDNNISDPAVSFVKIFNSRDYNKGYPGFDTKSLTNLTTGNLQNKISAMNDDINNKKDPYNKDWKDIDSLKTVKNVVINDTVIYDHSNEGYYTVKVSWHADTTNSKGTVKSAVEDTVILVKKDDTSNKYLCFDIPDDPQSP